MFAMRLKLGSLRDIEWKCCFCLHVRTATIIFGIWHLILHVLALTVLALIMRNHHVIIQANNGDFQQNDFLPTPLSKVKDDDNPYYLPTTQEGNAIYTNIDMGALMTVCTLSITLLMVYGAIKGKATQLLPFFCLQLFDFAITTLTATGYFCYLRSVHRLVAEHWNLPFRQALLQLSPQVLSLVVLAAFLLSMLWKAYWISTVWRCYKYLTLRQQAIRNTIHYILPESSDRANDSDFPSLFRDHESAFTSVMKQTPPPSYQDIMEDQPPPYPTSLQTEQEKPYRWRLPSFYLGGCQSEIQSSDAGPSSGSEEEAPIALTSRVEANVEVTRAEQQDEAAEEENVVAEDGAKVAEDVARVAEDVAKVAEDIAKVAEEEGAVALDVEVEKVEEKVQINSASPPAPKF